MKYANIIFEDNNRAVQCPAMYCRSTEPVVFDADEAEWLLYAAGEYDFTTYFNSLSVRKLTRYASACDYSLHCEVKGASCKLMQTYATSFSMESEEIQETSISIASSSEWAPIDIGLIIPKDAVIVAFKLITNGPVYFRGGHYDLEVDHPLNEVNLALATTTYKKEAYIEDNIKLIRQFVLGSDDDIANHFQMHVIDNGKTLDATALSGAGVTVYPNDNVGGAGGFARGMIQAMEQEIPATHVLLMDDDVSISPESIKRTYNLLRIANAEYRNAFISGAMLDYQIIEDQWEDTAAFLDGCCQSIKPRIRLTEVSDLVFNEDSEPTSEQKAHRYAAWWYCCIPMETIRTNGLPLPIFVRYDDVEYGLRSKPKHFMTMNGIGIWHMAFHVRYNPAVERYQTTRNGFIANACSGISNEKDLLAYMKDAIRRELKKYSYESAELVLDGFEDFLKGPDFIKGKVAEDCFMRANRMTEKLVPLEDLKGIPELHGYDLSTLTRQKINGNPKRTIGERFVDYVSWNGQKVPLFKDKGGIAIISVAGGDYAPGQMRNHATLLAVDWYSKKGVIRHRNIERYKAINKRYKQDLKYYKAHAKKINQAYSEARQELTSIVFWKKYLGI